MGSPKKACGQVLEIYSRVCGYCRPVKDWNLGKKEEFQDRVMFKVANNKLEEKDLVQVRAEEVLQDIDARVREASCV